MRRLVLVLAVTLVVPTTASARSVEDAFFNSSIATRADHLIGFTPTTFAIHPANEPVVPIKVRVRGRTHRFVFSNAAAAVTPKPDLRRMIRWRRYPGPEGVFLDRRLTRRERRHLKVQVDLGRDADVLVVAKGHPACAAGVSRTAVRKIATGKIRTWSGAGVPVPASGDAIALWRAGSGPGRSSEPRFGAGWRAPKGATVAWDGGIAEAAGGDLSTAAVTSWSRARAYQPTTCAVPIGGVAPTDESVRALSHPDAYPISFVTLRRLRGVRPIVAAFVKYVGGPRATASFRQRGMLLVGDTWPIVPGSP